MFRERTVFVIGAGASAEADFPIGLKLAAQLAGQLRFEFDDFDKLMNGDKELWNTIRVASSEGQFNFDNLISKSHSFSVGLALASSIDTYLHTHSYDPDLVLCGKIAIVNAILKAEKSTSIFVRNSSDQLTLAVERFRATWYWTFVDLLFSGVQKSQLAEVFSNVSIICFNYDRCIEQVLKIALSNYFGLSNDDSSALASKLEIIHPYGSVGLLFGRQHVPFGSNPRQISLYQSAMQIRTFTEQAADPALLGAIHRSLINANNIVFMGFSFQEQNIELLKPPEETGPKKVFATAFESSDSLQGIYKNRILKLFNGTRKGIDGSMTSGQTSIEMAPSKCAEFLWAYSREISNY